MADIDRSTDALLARVHFFEEARFTRTLRVDAFDLKLRGFDWRKLRE